MLSWHLVVFHPWLLLTDVSLSFLKRRLPPVGLGDTHLATMSHCDMSHYVLCEVQVMWHVFSSLCGILRNEDKVTAR